MKFDTVSKIANEAKNQFDNHVPSWSIDEAVSLIDYIAKNSSTREGAAGAIFDLWEEEGAEFPEWGITREQFVAQVTQ